MTMLDKGSDDHLQVKLRECIT